MRGMTLTEVLVYCILLSLFLLLLFINLPTRGSVSSEDLRQAAASADNALERLTKELSNASATSVSSVASPPGVVFLVATNNGASNFTYTTSGELAWRGWVGYFLVDKALVRVWHPLGSAVDRSGVTTTPTYATMVASKKQSKLIGNVGGFTVSLPEANLWQFDLKMSVKGNITTVTSGAAARN